jgi:hypothetical protein
MTSKDSFAQVIKEFPCLEDVKTSIGVIPSLENRRRQTYNE